MLSAYSLESGGLQGSKQVVSLVLIMVMVGVVVVVEVMVMTTIVMMTKSCQVPIAGETRASRERVASLVTAAGFTPLDLGELQVVRNMIMIVMRAQLWLFSGLTMMI